MMAQTMVKVGSGEVRDILQQTVAQLKMCTRKLEEFLDLFQDKRNRETKKSVDWRAQSKLVSTTPPSNDLPEEVWFVWLLQRLIKILEYTHEVVIPQLVSKVLVPVTFIVVIAAFFPPMGYTTTAIFSGLGIGIGTVCAFQKILPELIKMLKTNLRYVMSRNRINFSCLMSELDKFAVTLRKLSVPMIQ